MLHSSLQGASQPVPLAYDLSRPQQLAAGVRLATIWTPECSLGKCPPARLGAGSEVVQYCDEDNWRLPLSETSEPACVALGKFDALHLGHR